MAVRCEDISVLDVELIERRELPVLGGSLLRVLEIGDLSENRDLLDEALERFDMDSEVVVSL